MNLGISIGYSIFHILMIVWATVVGSGKGRPLAGFLLGLFFSFIGVIIIYLLKPKTAAYAR